MSIPAGPFYGQVAGAVWEPFGPIKGYSPYRLHRQRWFGYFCLFLCLGTSMGVYFVLGQHLWPSVINAGIDCIGFIIGGIFALDDI